MATVETTLAMTQESGQINAELRISDGTLDIGTTNFVLSVEPAPHPAGTTDGTTEEARTVLEQCAQYAQEAQEAAGEVPSQVQDLVDAAVADKMEDIEDAVQSVTDAATQAVSDINAAGEAVEESIPADYTALSTQVSQLQSDLGDVDESLGDIRNIFLTSIDGENVILNGMADNCPIADLKIAYPYNENGYTNVYLVLTNDNIFGGLEFANAIKKVVPSAEVDATNKTVTFSGSRISGKTIFEGNFKDNTPYTIVLYGRNLSESPSVYTNILVKYTDGTTSSNNLRFENAGVNSYAVFTTQTDKTIASIVGSFNVSSTILYYDKCGVFEGIKNVSHFVEYRGKQYIADLSELPTVFYGGSVDFISGEVIINSDSSGDNLEVPLTYYIAPLEIIGEKYYTKIFTDGNYINISYCQETRGTVNELMFNPDVFSGTDSEKLQQAFDSLANIGGNIVINREYILSSDIVINNDSDLQHFIRVIGVGKNARINCGSYRITAPKYRHVYGGIMWESVAFTGTDTCFDAGLLIRLFFTHCSFKGFRYVFRSDVSEYVSGETSRYMQSLYLLQCTIKGCEKGFYIDGRGAYNVGIGQTLIENVTNAFYNASGTLMGVRIYDCVIEVVSGNSIHIGGKVNSLSIQNNYFEACLECIHLSANNIFNIVSIASNYFVANNKSAIFIEPINNELVQTQKNKNRGVITGNTYLDTSDNDNAFIKFTSVPVISQAWVIKNNSPNTINNSDFLISSNNILASENEIDTIYVDGWYYVENESEIIQVKSVGNLRIQIRYKAGNNLSFRMMEIGSSIWSTWSS